MKTPKSLGRYEVIDAIGHGGMGALFRARDPRIGRYVAVKLLRPEFDTPEIRDRFSREARAAGSLSHPNIVTIYDVGEHEGLPFIAMEYVRGETFSDLVCLRPPLSVTRKLQLTEEVCAGLAHAHEAGIVHRDIKPANLIVGPEGTVKILDFGIAKMIASDLTLTGAVMGTLNYMSPEQVSGTSVDARADIFSVGAVLYELLSHQPAFPGHIPDEVFPEILNGVPKPITDYVPDIHPRLVHLVERALEKDPNRRFQDIASLQKELASIRLAPQSGAMPPSISSRADGPVAPSTTRDRTRRGAPPSAEPETRGQSRNVTAGREASNVPSTEIRATIERARAKYEDGDPTAAFVDIAQVLALDAKNVEAQALEAAATAAIREQEEEARLRAAVDDARRRFDKGEHQEALQSLEALQPGTNAFVAATLDELRLALAEIEEQQRAAAARAEQQRQIAALLQEARTALKANRLDAATQTLEQVRGIDANASELADLSKRVRLAQAAAKVEEELQRALGDFDGRLAQGDLQGAAGPLKTAAGLAPADPRIVQARQRLEQAMTALAAKEAAEARRREGEQAIEEAAARLEQGDLAGAADLLGRAAALVPQHPRGTALSEQLREALERQAAAEAAERLKRQVDGLVTSASQRLKSADESGSDLVLALREVIEAIALDAEHVDARKLKTVIEESIAARREAARVQAAISNARRRFANGKHQAALQVLEQFQPASHPEIAVVLGELRGALHAIEEQRRAERERAERQERVAALLVEARAAIGDRRFDAALDVLAKAGEIDGAAPELASLTERVHQEQAAARRRADLEQALAQVNEGLTRGDLAAAADRLGAATTLDAADARVLAARRRVEQAIAARAAAEAGARELEEKTTAAEALFERGDLQGAARLLALAAKLDPQHAPAVLLSERVADAIRKQEAADAAERGRRTVEELLAAAAELLRSPVPNVPDAMAARQKITDALSLAPGDAGALALKSEVEETLAALREAARIAAAIRNARSRFAIGKHQAALQLLESLDPSHPGVADALEELRTALRATPPTTEDVDRTVSDTRTATPIPSAETAARPGRWDAVRRLWKK